MSWVEQKYANLLGPTLRNFKVKRNSPYLANFSCTVCKDSEKNKRKARAYIGEKNGKLFYYCHNCHASLTFSNFLYEHDKPLYRQYALENFSANNQPSYYDFKEKTIMEWFEPKGAEIYDLERINELDKDHPAYQYLEKRKIPFKFYNELRYTDDFSKEVNKIFPNKLKEIKDERIIIPFRDKNGLLFGFQGRSINPNNKVRYITIMLTDKIPKVFGLDRVDFVKDPVYVVEGPFDSLFLDNCIAMAGSDLDSNFLNSNCVYVMDNEPRNKDVCHEISKIINKGFRVCLWPEYIKEKDLNEMILSGKTPLDIKTIIDNNTFRGLEAKLKFTSWRK